MMQVQVVIELQGENNMNVGIDILARQDAQPIEGQIAMKINELLIDHFKNLPQQDWMGVKVMHNER